MNIEAKHILNGREPRRNKQASSSLLTELAECAPEDGRSHAARHHAERPT